MTEPKFTPGPWEWYKADGEYRTLINDCLHMIIRSVRPEDMWFCPENRDANAALIAAAPELYEVAERYVDYLKSELFHLGPPPEGHICGPEGNCDSVCEARYYLTSDLEKAKAALQKANGGAI